MSTSMQIDEIAPADGRAAVLAMSGDLDLLSAPELYQRGAQALADRRKLILDMSRVTFCDSSGFNTLLRLRRRAEEADVGLVLAALPNQVRRLLVLSGAEMMFTTTASLGEAQAGGP